MSIPVITPSTTTKEQAIADLIESVALQEVGLSSILSAEGQKIQTVSQMASVTPDQLLAVNASVQSMMNAAARLEIILQSKLNIFAPQVSA